MGSNEIRAPKNKTIHAKAMNKAPTLLAMLGAFLLSACSDQQPSAPQSNVSPAPPVVTEIPKSAPKPEPTGPESMRGENWEFVVNNAVRTAGEYAAERNPDAIFIGDGLSVDFTLQFAGEHKGRHLLMLTNRHGGNTSFAVLLPLFDENKPSDDLDDQGKLWKVISAKYNGRTF